ARIARQAMEGRAVETGERFELVERARGVERLGVELERAEGGIAAGTAARVLLERRSVRRAVGAEEEAFAARGRRRHQRSPMLFAFQDGQAVVVRPDAAREDG